MWFKRLGLKRVSLQVNRECERFCGHQSKSRTEEMEERMCPDGRFLHGWNAAAWLSPNGAAS